MGRAPESIRDKAKRLGMLRDVAAPALEADSYESLLREVPPEAGRAIVEALEQDRSRR
ncbi:MAG: hypothetical protein ACRDIU_02290 [Actinomycetota bacterium]